MALQTKKFSLTKLLHIYSGNGNNSHPLKERSTGCLAAPLSLSASGKSFELLDLIFALRVLTPYLGR